MSCESSETDMVEDVKPNSPIVPMGKTRSSPRIRALLERKSSLVPTVAENDSMGGSDSTESAEEVYYISENDQ